MAAVDDAVYACPREANRGGCRFGPQDNRVGWTDEDYDRMWYVSPAARQGLEPYPGILLSIEVVPCAEHAAALAKAYPADSDDRR
jgi:hypothetical protein